MTQTGQSSTFIALALQSVWLKIASVFFLLSFASLFYMILTLYRNIHYLLPIKLLGKEKMQLSPTSQPCQIRFWLHATAGSRKQQDELCQGQNEELKVKYWNRISSSPQETMCFVHPTVEVTMLPNVQNTPLLTFLTPPFQMGNLSW